MLPRNKLLNTIYAIYLRSFMETIFFIKTGTVKVIYMTRVSRIVGLEDIFKNIQHKESGYD